MRYLHIMLVICALALPATALAGYHGKSDGGFGKMDADGDGTVSRAEFAKTFDAWDADGDGELTMEEWSSSHGMGHGMGMKPKGSDDCQGAHGGHGKMMKGNVHYPTLEDVDGDGDGMLSKMEYNKAVKGGGFDLIDTDKSGMLEAKEWEAFRAAHMGFGKMKY